mgnify:FL=1
MTLSTKQDYDDLTKIFHWLTAVVVLAAFVYGPGGSEIQIYSAQRDLQHQIHETLGLTVFVLLFLRLSWQWIASKPARSDEPSWMLLLANIVQKSLYALLFLVPITAVMGAWLEGHPITLLIGLEFAPPFSAAHTAGKTIAEIHSLLDDTLIWLAGFHALAAIFHHVIWKDDVLTSMMPSWMPLPK